MKITNCADALRRHHFEVETVRDTDEAFAVIKAAVETERPETVSFGDSMSMRATGVIEWLRGDERYRLLDGFDPAMTYPQRLEIRRQALMSDLFITGVNAVTAEGTLHWLDKVGNRIAPVAFGPRKVIIVAGRNKIVANRDEAEERIRTIAAPQNIARHPGFRTPCAKTGVCSDCNSPDRVCNTRMEMLRCWPDKRVLVVDDVISTGGSLKALDALAEQTQCTIVGQAAVLAEGDAAERKDIIFLEPLPLFFH